MTACESCIALAKEIALLKRDLAEAQAAVDTMTNAFLKAREGKKGKANG